MFSQKIIINLLYKLLFLIEAGWLFIDAIGGYLQNNPTGESSFNSLIRGLILAAALLLLLLDTRIKGRWLPFGLLAVLLILTSIQYIFFEKESLDLNVLFKIILLPVFLVCIKSQLENGYLTSKKIELIININTLVLLFNICLSFFKIGYSNYGISKDGSFVGGTGFFYAGNEVGGVLLVLSGLGLYYYSGKKLVNLLLASIVYLLCAMGLLSKTALISVALNIFFIFFLSKPYKSILVFFCLILISFFVQEYIISQLGLFWNRITFFAQQYSWQTVLTGGYKRQNALDDFFLLLQEMPGIIFIGNGWKGVMENNFFDVFEAFGIIGYVFFIIPGHFFVQSLKRFSLKKKTYWIVIFNAFLIFIVSITAGHVLQSAMISPFLALLLNVNYLDSDSTQLSE